MNYVILVHKYADRTAKLLFVPASVPVSGICSRTNSTDPVMNWSEQHRLMSTTLLALAVNAGGICPPGECEHCAVN